MASLAMMLGCRRASGKAVHSPLSSVVARLGESGSGGTQTRLELAMRQLVGQMTIRRRKGEIVRNSLEVLHQSTNRSRSTPALEESSFGGVCLQPCEPCGVSVACLDFSLHTHSYAEARVATSCSPYLLVVHDSCANPAQDSSVFEFHEMQAMGLAAIVTVHGPFK